MIDPARLSAAQRRAILDASWTGILPADVGERTYLALVARGLAWTERRRWLADRRRLTDKGLAIRAELDAAEHVVIDLDSVAALGNACSDLAATTADALIIWS